MKKLLVLASIVSLLLSLSCFGGGDPPATTNNTPLNDLIKRVGALEQTVGTLSSRAAEVSKADIQGVQASIASLQSTLATVQQSYLTLKTQVDGIKAPVLSDYALKTDITALSTRIASLEAAANTFNGKISSLETTTNTLKTDLTALTTKLNDLTGQLNTFKTDINAKVAAHETRIAALEARPVSTAAPISVKAHIADIETGDSGSVVMGIIDVAGSYGLIIKVYGQYEDEITDIVATSSKTLQYFMVTDDEYKTTAVYNTGRVDINLDSTIIHGHESGSTTKTEWTQDMVGGVFRRLNDEISYTIEEVDEDEQTLTLDEPFDATYTDARYTIVYSAPTANCLCTLFITSTTDWKAGDTFTIDLDDFEAKVATIEIGVS